MESKYIRVPL